MEYLLDRFHYCSAFSNMTEQLNPTLTYRLYPTALFSKNTDFCVEILNTAGCYFMIYSIPRHSLCVKMKHTILICVLFGC